MKTSARFLAMLLAVVMIAGAALSVSAFDDVAGNKHANAINVLAQLKVIGGYEDGTFKPDQKVTRAEMAKLVYVLYTTFVDAGTGATAFADVAADNWAAGYIRWCSQKGIIGGYGNGTFGPTDNVTYDQALKMVAGVLGYNEWDSALWPTDVRMLALRTLNLGEELEDVNGNDQLTRAQVAQILYNALDEEMNEKKTVNVEITGGFTMPVEVAKKLAVDVWKFTESAYTVVATDNYAIVGSAVAEDEVTLAEKNIVDGEFKGYKNAKTYELEKLGLEAYEDKTDALIGLEVIALYDSVKEEMLGGVTISGTVLDGVAVSVNKNENVLTVNGTEYTYEDEIKLWTLASTVKADEIFTVADKNGEYTKVDADLIKALEKAYFARAIDADGDGETDALVIVPKKAFKVTNIDKTTDKNVSYETLAGVAQTKIPSAKVSIELAKEDIFVGAMMGGILYAEKVEPVETYATKLNAKAGKVTLADVGEVVYAATIEGAAKTEIATNNLGAENKTGFYIYDGEIILANDLKKVSDYNFAILKEIVEKEDDEVNKETMEAGVSYIATLIVNGEEVKATLASKPIADDDVTTAEDLYKTYKRTTTVGGKVNYNYALVAAYEEEDGVYTLTMSTALNEDDVLVEKAKNAKLSYNVNGYYTLSTDENKVIVLNDASRIYYTYEKDATGDFQHLGSYTKDTITTKAFENQVIIGDTYLVTEDNGETYTLLATIVKGEIKGSAADTITYANDGTLILYAPVDSNAVYDETDKKNYYEYVFMDNETLENKEPVIDKTKAADDKTDAATATESGKFYAWDATAEEYIEVKAKADTESFKAVTLEKIVVASGNNLLRLAGGSTIKLSDEVAIWGLDATEEETNDTYVTFTVSELKAMLDLVAEYNEDNKAVEGFEALSVRAILVQVEDANGDFALDTIIVEVFETNEEDDELVESINDAIFGAKLQ